LYRIPAVSHTTDEYKIGVKDTMYFCNNEIFYSKYVAPAGICNILSTIAFFSEPKRLAKKDRPADRRQEFRPEKSIFAGGSLFGIGSYIRHLIYCLKKSSYTVTVVSIRLNVKEISIQHIDEIRHIGIPQVNMSKFLTDEKHSQIYQESIAYILNPYITKSDNNIFHLNYEDNIYLARKLKKYLVALFYLLYTTLNGVFTFQETEKKLQI